VAGNIGDPASVTYIPGIATKKYRRTKKLPLPFEHLIVLLCFEKVDVTVRLLHFRTTLAGCLVEPVELTVGEKKK
jgi:hypothetical protein